MEGKQGTQCPILYVLISYFWLQSRAITEILFSDSDAAVQYDSAYMFEAVPILTMGVKLLQLYDVKIVALLIG